MSLEKWGLDKLPLLPPLSIESTPFNDRRISIKWLLCIFSTSFAAASLMAAALFVASEGRVQFTKLPSVAQKLASDTALALADGEQGTRIMFTIPRHRFENKKQFEFTTTKRSGGKAVLEPQTFEAIHMGLAELRSGHFKYPPFNALDIFASAPINTGSQDLGQIYKQNAADEIKIENANFDTNKAAFSEHDNINETEAKLYARKFFRRLSKPSQESTLLLYDYLKKNQKSNNKPTTLNSELKIITENLSILNKTENENSEYGYAEDLIPFSKNQSITEALDTANYQTEANQEIIQALTKYLLTDRLDYNGIIRLGLASDEDGNEAIIRITIYKDATAILTIAADDNNNYVKANAPEMTPILSKALSGKLPVLNIEREPLMSLYDSIYRATLSYGLPEELTKQLFRVLAVDIDLQAPTTLTDTIDIFYPYNKDNKDIALFYINANISGKIHKYYRYQNAHGSIDYYNANGKSARQFLLRKPVPSGHFTSPFGSRRHPILGYVRMHTGVDWGAKKGTAIIAAGDGIVINASPTRGYGNHTEIQHANGYVTSYSHQSGFAAGIQPGAHVKQGQIIGYVGSTGLSTGAHCHFEILVNKTRVDPMRVRIPDSKSLAGRELSLFEQTRNSIDNALNENRF